MTDKLRPVIVSTFSPPALACIRSWGKQGWEPGMICIRSDREAKPASRYLHGWITLPPEKLHSEEGIQRISHFLNRFKADGIIAINEKISCWINHHRDALPLETGVWLSDNAVFNEILSKHSQAEVAQHVGMNVLPTWLIDKNTKAETVDFSCFPLCLRPSVPGGVRPSFKVHIVSSPEHLEKYLCHFDAIREPLIAQPFLSLPNLVIHGTRTQKGDTIGLQAFLVARKFEGVTLTIQAIDIPEDLGKKCIAFTNAFHLVGNYHFEFLFDPQTGKNWFLEINSRFGGTTAKVLACGYDEPLFALQAYGTEPDNFQTMQNVTVSNKVAQLKYLYYALTKRLTPMDYPAESLMTKLGKTLHGLFFHKDDVFRFTDMKGTVAMYAGNLMAKFR